jgi:hypothetical protein
VKSKKHVGTLPLRYLTAINEVGNGGGWLSHQQPPDPLSISDQVVNMIKIENFLCKFSSSKTGWCGLGGHVCFFQNAENFFLWGFLSPNFERNTNLKITRLCANFQLVAKCINRFFNVFYFHVFNRQIWLNPSIANSATS